VALTFCGYSGGTAVGGLVNGALLQAHRWPIIFLIGGILPLALAVPLMLFLPESLRFRARRNPRDPHIGRLLLRMDPTLQFDGTESFVLTKDAELDTGRLAIGALFIQKRRPLTLLLWLLFALSIACITTMGAWTATVLNTGVGLPIAQVGVLIAVFAGAGLCGTGTSGFIMDRIGAGRTLFVFYMGCGIFMLSLAVADYHSSVIYPLMALAGYCVSGAQGALNAFSSNAYPTRMRATGVGWAFGAGRIGGIFGPIAGGRLIAREGGNAVLFAALAVPFLLVALFVPILMRTARNSIDS